MIKSNLTNIFYTCKIQLIYVETEKLLTRY